ncbi:phage head morphogenesis protein, partial [Elysia marginata]
MPYQGKTANLYIEEYAITAELDDGSRGAITKEQLADILGSNIIANIEFKANGKVIQDTYLLEDIEVDTNLLLRVKIAQIQAVKDDFPYWQYIAVKDSRTRDNHRALDGRIFKVNDTEFYPPIGFNCRCTARPITKKNAEPLLNTQLTKPQQTILKKALPNSEFVGNKNQLFLQWADKHFRQMQPQDIRNIQKGINSQAYSSIIPPVILRKFEKYLEKITTATVSQRAKTRYNRLEPTIWHKEIFYKNGGFVAIDKSRIAHSTKSKNTKAVFEKELRMSKVFAKNGCRIKMIEEAERTPKYDVIFNGKPAELKSVKGHNNIVNYAKDAIRRKGAK